MAITDWDASKPATDAALASSIVRGNFSAAETALFDADASLEVGSYLRGFRTKQASITLLEVSPGAVFLTGKGFRRKATATFIDTTVVGADGMDATVVINTWYYVWLLNKTSDDTVHFALSSSATSPTAITGHTFERVIAAWWYDDGTNKLKPGFTIGNWQDRIHVWDVSFGDITATNVWQLTAGVATIATALALSTANGGIPPASVTGEVMIFPTLADIYLFKDSGTDSHELTLNGSLGGVPATTLTWGQGIKQSNGCVRLTLQTDDIQYLVNNAGFNAYIAVQSYTYRV